MSECDQIDHHHQQQQQQQQQPEAKRRKIDASIQKTFRKPPARHLSSTDNVNKLIKTELVTADKRSMAAPVTPVKNKLSDNSLAKLLSRDMQSTDVKIVAAATKKLYNACDVCAETRKQASLSGAPLLLLMAMSKWKNTEQVQKYACATLQIIVFDIPGMTMPFDSMVLDSIVSAMENFPESKKLQLVSCEALSSLFSNLSCDPASQSSSAELFVKELNGMQIILRAMRSFRKDALVQECALNLMHVLFHIPGCKIPIRMSGAITAVAKAIDSHKQNKDVQERGGQVMKCFFP